MDDKESGKLKKKNTWAKRALVRLQFTGRPGEHFGKMQMQIQNANCKLQNGDAVCGAGRGGRSSKRRERKKEKKYRGRSCRERSSAVIECFFSLSPSYYSVHTYLILEGNCGFRSIKGQVPDVMRSGIGQGSEKRLELLGR
jgi:hypothetical protein